MGVNTQINKFKNDLINFINNSHLQPAIIHLVLENILTQVVQIENEEIRKESSEDSKNKNMNGDVDADIICDNIDE